MAASRSARPPRGCAEFPEIEVNATGTPARSKAWQNVARPRRRPHALDGVRVPRRVGALRPAVAQVRRRVRARGLRRPLGRRRLQRGARERPVRQPGALPRLRRLADVHRLARPAVADARELVLQVGRAGVARRPADLREPAGREQGALRPLSAQAERLQRDGQRAPSGPRPERAAGLRRRPVRRARARDGCGSSTIRSRLAA